MASLTRCVFLSAISLIGMLSVSAYEVRDVRSNTFNFDSPPRFATIVPSVTQTIYSIGAEFFMLANSRYCYYPEEAKSVPKIGGYIDPDYEKIAELHPQLFILPDVKDSRIPDRLKTLGIPCFFIHSEGLDNISENIRLLGKLFKREAAAEKIASEFESDIKPSNRTKIKPNALFMFGEMAAGKGSFAGDVVKAAGAVNLAEKSNAVWPVLSREFILAANPDILFVEIPDGIDENLLKKRYLSDPIWKNTEAVKKSRICFVPRKYITVPSPQVAKAVLLMRNFVESQGLK